MIEAMLKVKAAIKTAVLVAIMMPLAACDSTSVEARPSVGSNPTEFIPGDISGHWSGQWSNSETLVESCGTVNAPFSMTLTQSGDDLSGTASLSCAGTIIENAVSGTVSGGKITLTDSFNRDTFTLVVNSNSEITGAVIDTSETYGADITISRTVSN